jgi:hypothetical protein
MRKLTLAVGVAAVLALPAAAAGYGPNENPHAVAACEKNIAKQSAKGVTAGGGPKAGTPAPTNCDHFYQDNGTIGNGLPGGATP